MIQTRSKYDLVGVEPLGKVLFQFLGRGENLLPAFVLLLEARAQILHLVLVARRRSPCRTAADIRASRGARAKRDMDMKIVRVVVQSRRRIRPRHPDEIARRISPSTFFMVEWKTRSGLMPDGNELVVQFADIEKTKRC